MNCPAGPPLILCATSLCPLLASGNPSLKLASRKLNFCCWVCFGNPNPSRKHQEFFRKKMGKEMTLKVNQSGVILVPLYWDLGDTILQPIGNLGEVPPTSVLSVQTQNFLFGPKELHNSIIGKISLEKMVYLGQIDLYKKSHICIHFGNMHVKSLTLISIFIASFSISLALT